MTGLPRTERPDAPAYLQRHQQREAAKAGAPAARSAGAGSDEDDNVPLYLRRFRDRNGASGRAASDLSYEGESLGTS